jgi:hypothetical protein
VELHGRSVTESSLRAEWVVGGAPVRRDYAVNWRRAGRSSGGGERLTLRRTQGKQSTVESRKDKRGKGQRRDAECAEPCREDVAGVPSAVIREEKTEKPERRQPGFIAQEPRDGKEQAVPPGERGMKIGGHPPGGFWVSADSKGL